MASNLRVDSIVPATGSSVSIGTATGGVNIPGVLTYEDVTNVDSIGIVTARGGIRIGTGGTVGPVGSGIVTYYGDGSQLTGAGPTFTNGADNRVITATSASAITGESNLIFTGTRLGLNKTSPAPLNGDGTGMIHVAGGNPELVLERTTSGTESKASIRVTDGEDFKIAVKDGSGSTIDALAIDTGTGHVTKPYQPAFHARLQNNTTSTTNPLVYGDVRVNNGSHYNSSGSDAGKFIAPVNGMYFFYLVAVKYNNGSVCRLYPYVNGSKIYNNMHLRLQETGTYSNGSLQFIYTCGAGDKVHVSLESGDVLGAEYTHFGGYLIG